VFNETQLRLRQPTYREEELVLLELLVKLDVADTRLDDLC
jgi:hypothetical protein